MATRPTPLLDFKLAWVMTNIAPVPVVISQQESLKMLLPILYILSNCIVGGRGKRKIRGRWWIKFHLCYYRIDHVI
jgi:hypothetical protein